MWHDDERKGEGETRCRLMACSSRKAPRGPPGNVPIRRTNRYQQYYMPSQHTYCGRVWNLIQACDVQSSDQKVYIFTPPSPEVENFQIKIYYPAGDRTILTNVKKHVWLTLNAETLLPVQMIVN